jgi:SulP family sulfate permease
VTGIDFSAAEAFSRIHRILAAKHVQMIVCSVSRDEGDIAEALRLVGFWEEGKAVETFVDLNSALEYCENQLLRAFYSRRDALAQRNGGAQLLGTSSHCSYHHSSSVPNSASDIPKPGGLDFSVDTSFSSPRRHHLQRVATTTLNDQEAEAPSRWQNFQQPLPLILQTFQGLTDKNEDFWFRACSYLQRLEYPAGTVLYRGGDAPDGFYLLEDGILRAEYDLPQGKYYESIVAGTTCGELPFFSETNRTATVTAERDCVAWLLNDERWEKLRKEQPEISQELLRLSLKLTSERMAAITS